MDSRRFLGPPLMFVGFVVLVVIGVVAALLVEQGPIPVIGAALAAVVAWRLLGLAVYFDQGDLVVRNTLKTFRFPVREIDIRAKIVDPRVEQFSSGSSAGYPEIPITPDDNTPNSAKWYILEHNGDQYFIDALMGRWPANHERLALDLRHEILAVAETSPESNTGDTV